MQIISVKACPTNTYNKDSQISNNKQYPSNHTSVYFCAKIPTTNSKSFFGKLKEFVELPKTIIKEIKAQKQAKIDAKVQLELEELARKNALLEKRQKLEEERRLAEESARFARRQAEELKLESYKKLTEEQLAQEYANCEKTNNYIWARHIKNILKEKGFVLLDGKPVKEFSHEAYRPLEVLPYDNLAGATFIPKLGINPPLVKNEHIALPPARGNYGIEHFSIYNFNYAQRGFGQIKFPKTIFSANTGIDIPAKERGWAVSHTYRPDLKDIGKVHYCTSLSYNHEMTIHGHAPGFSIHIEGIIPESDLEKIKNILIDNGHMEQIIKAEGNEPECNKAFKGMIEEIIEFLNKTDTN